MLTERYIKSTTYKYQQSLKAQSMQGFENMTKNTLPYRTAPDSEGQNFDKITNFRRLADFHLTNWSPRAIKHESNGGFNFSKWCQT